MYRSEDKEKAGKSSLLTLHDPFAGHALGLGDLVGATFVLQAAFLSLHEMTD